MNIRDQLELNELATVPNSIDFDYTEQGNGVDIGGGSVGIVYLRSSGGYYAATSTKYTQIDQPYVRRSGDDMSGELTNSTRFDGGFAIQNRPRLG